MGTSPGGGNSNFWTILLDGNLDLSVTMTFFSSIAAFGAMPAWLYSLGPLLYPGAIRIPFSNMAGSLLVLVLPCLAGLAFRRQRPEWKVHEGGGEAKASLLLDYFGLGDGGEW